MLVNSDSLNPDSANRAIMALSLLLRAAEWLRALPALLLWQASEGSRWWKRAREKSD